MLQYIPRCDGLAFKYRGCCTAILERTLGASSLLAMGPAGLLACLSLGRMGLAKPSCLGNPGCRLAHSWPDRHHPHDQTSSGKGADAIVASRRANLKIDIYKILW